MRSLLLVAGVVAAVGLAKDAMKRSRKGSRITLEEAKQAGYDQGYEIATGTDFSVSEWLDKYAEDYNEDEQHRMQEDLSEAFGNWCSEADENYRSYSPWEFFAHDMNEEEDSDSLWEEFEAGVGEGIMDGINEVLGIGKGRHSFRDPTGQADLRSKAIEDYFATRQIEGQEDRQRVPVQRGRGQGQGQNR